MTGGVIIGIDPGLANCGMAAVRLHKFGEELLAVKVVTTVKSDKKLDVRASSDDVRRAQELAGDLVAFCAAHPPMAFAVEAMSFPRNSSSAAKLGMCWGVISATAHARGIPVLQASPQQIKLALCGVKSASKAEVMAAVEVAHPEIFWPKPRSLWEHAADAVGAVHGCLDSPVAQMVRQSIRPVDPLEEFNS